MTDSDLVDAIRAALGTEETGENLIFVARAAHDAEQKLAVLVSMWLENDDAVALTNKLEEFSWS